MWDRPELLNPLASLLYAVAAALALWAGAAAVTGLPVFALREVRIAGAPLHVAPADLEAVVRRDLRGNFFTLDLAATRAALGRVAWVREVDVRRRWPGALVVALEEHVPLARWSDRGLVNTHGEVFEAAYEGALPVFEGPDGTAKEMAIQYEYFRRRLAEVGETPARLRVTARRAWEIGLASGMTLALGRSDVEARLSRFVAAYGDTVGRLGRRIRYVDLRYPNGFAVRIPELAPSMAPARVAPRRKGRAA